MKDCFTLPVLTTDNSLRSIFVEQSIESHERNAMFLSEQIKSINLRLRKSAAGYSSHWHIAGDPTLIIIQQGILRIFLRDNCFKDFAAGDCFVAQDNLPEGVVFDPMQHGHRAEVIGEEPLHAVHIKLAACL